MRGVLLALLLGVAAAPALAQGPEAARAGAPLDPGGFRYTREILPREPGLVVLTLDAAVLAHSSLGDLRILNSENRQVPYLLEASPEPLELELPAPERVPAGESRGAGAEGTTRYRFRLPYGGLPAARLVLATREEVFERSVRLEGAPAPRGEPKWSRPAAMWRDADPQRPAPTLELELPARPGETVDVVIDEGDNATIALEPARLRLATWRLRFFHPGREGARLLYGREDLAAPRYDLSLVADRLDPAQARIAVLAPEPPPGERRDPARARRTLFWGALLAAVAVLLLVLARLLREEKAGV